MKVFGYDNVSLINASHNYNLWEALLRKDNKHVLLRSNACQSKNRINELDFFSKVEGNFSVLPYPVESDDQSLFVMDYFQGNILSPLDLALSENIEKKIKISISLAKLLERIHDAKIVHNHFAPYNILISPKHDEAKVLEFSNSFFLNEKGEYSPQVDHSSFLNYISPELTGRTGRSPDYRSDLYSLGMILYELFSGVRPFSSDDPFRMIHFHLAKEVVPLKDVKDIPEALSQIIQKLLNKEPDNRFQTATGLRYDLEKCLSEFKDGVIQPFIIGSHDVILKCPDKVFGREEEISKIKDLLTQAEAGNKVVCIVSGMSGSGKSSLVKHIQKDFTEGQFFLQSKSNQFEQNYPFSAFIQIIQDFVNAVLRDNEATINNFGTLIRDHIGNSGRVLTDLVPELELIIGKQQDISMLPMEESRKRFSYIVRKFFKVIATNNSALTIFFDDIQWLDKSSFDLLIDLLCDKEINNLMFIAAVREEEPRDIRNKLFLKLNESNEKYHHISIDDLKFSAFLEYISSTLNLDTNAVQELTKVVYAKTSGNPFFAGEFLRSILKKSILRFDSQWVWDLEQIKSIRISDNAVKFIQSKLSDLPEETSLILQLASCLGGRFTPRIFQMLVSMSLDRIKNHLDIGLEENLLIKSGESYRFSHDGIQQAANALITDPLEMHLQIARSFKARMSSDEQEKHLLTLVYHYNLAIPFLSDEDERSYLAHLNHRAARKMKRNAAFQPFFEYSRSAILLLPGNDWDSNTSLAIDIFILYAEAAYLVGNFEEMEIAIEKILKHTQNLEKRIKVYEISILAYIAQSRLKEAIDTGLYVLELLKVSLPKNPNKLQVLSQIAKIVTYLKLGGEDKLAENKSLNDENIYSAIKIICTVGAAAYNTNPDLYVVLSCKAFELILKHGHCEYSGFICASFGSLLIGGLGMINFGYKIGSSANELLIKYGNNGLRCKTNFLINNFVTHWKHHLRESLYPLTESYKTGLENGDTEYSAYGIFVHNFNAFFSGMQLEELKEIMMNNFSIVQNIKHKMPIIEHGIFSQTVVNLNGTEVNAFDFRGKYFNEDEMLNLIYSEKIETAVFEFHLCKFYLHFLFGNIKEARAHANQARIRLSSVIGSSLILIFYFYDSLILVSAIDDTHFENKYQLRRTLNSNLKKLKRMALNAPMNGLHKYYLVKAEQAKLKGKVSKALGFYQKAIVHARTNKYINEEALAYELMAKFYLRERNQIHYENFLIKACELYGQWGAKAKVNALDKDVSGKSRSFQSSFSYEDESSTLHSLMKSATVLSEEIIQEKLLNKLIRIIMEHGGAEKAAFFLNISDKLKLVALGDIDKCSINTNGFGNDEDICPKTILSFVARKKERIIIDDARSDIQFSKDPYISKNQPKSIIVFPVVDQGKLEGILYLENNLSSNIFSAKTAEFLKIISGQLAISLRNSGYYEALEGEVRKRTKELTDANVTLTQQREEIYEQNEQLKEARDKAEESLKVKEDFLSLMSHEILTPLNVILGFTNLLMADKASGPIHNNIKKIKTAACTLQSLINDILYYVRIGSDKIVLIEEEFNLHELLMSIRIMFYDMIAEKGLELNFDVDASIPANICGDKNKLNQILINLIGNAVKFTHKGKIDVHVNLLEFSESVIDLGFSVSDTGIGIEESKFKIIFEEFAQASDNISKNYGGTGLGLAIVSKLVKLFGGEINVQSALHKGSVFTFDIKCKPNSGKDEHIESSIHSEMLTGKRILLVDDEVLNLELACEILKKNGAIISSTVSSFQAIELLKVNEYDLVITDLKMAEMSGTQLCVFIRRGLSYPKNEIPVLALTAHIFRNKKEIIEESGINEIVYKPVNAKELISSVCKLTGANKETDLINVELLADDQKTTFPYLSSIFQDKDVFYKHLEKHVNKLELYNNNLLQQVRDIDFKSLALTIHSIYNVLNTLDVKDLNDSLKRTEEVFEYTEQLGNSLMIECNKIRDSFSEIINQTNEN